MPGAAAAMMGFVRLRSYLVFLALATLLPVAVFGAIVGYFLVEEQRETFRRGAEERTLAVLTAVDTELQGSIGTLEALATLPALDDADLTGVRQLAERILARQPGWQNINVALPSGQQVLNLQVPQGAPLPNIGALDGSFARLRATGKPVVSDLAYGPVLKRWSFAVRVPVLREGRIKYVISAGIKRESISALIRAQRLPADWIGVIVDRNGRIVARNFDPGGTEGQMASESLREGLQRASSGWFRGTTLEGTEVYTPYRRSEISGWAFAMGIPAGILDASAWRGMAYLGVGLLGALALALILAAVVGRRLAAPMAELAAASEALGRGEATRVPHTAKVRELQRLARSFQASIDAMRASKEQMHSVVDNVVDGIISIDERGIIQTFNPAAERIFGYSAAEAIGRNVKVLMPEAYSREHDGYIASYARTGQAKFIGVGREVEGRRKDGSTFPLDLAVSVFHIGAGRYFTGVVRDITERKRAEDALRQADRHKDEFLATLSHELRNPLAALTTAAHVLKVGQPGSEAVASARDVVQRQTRQMARLVADLLDLSAISMGKMMLQRERLDLAQVVERLMKAWRLSGRFDRHAVSADVATAWVDGDGARVEQIAANLLDNALKFTPTGKAIAVEVREEAGGAIVRVKDEGVGVAPQDEARVFDMFAQGGGARGGMGIGLALVKRLAALHGGDVSVESAGAGRGSSFTVRLPRAAAPAAAVAAQPGAACRCSVLVVEDNDDARQMLHALLALEGHAVRAARDGASALALAAQSSPDVALIDIGLPDIDGYDLARRLRAAAAGRRLSLIALTGYGQAADQRRAAEAGFDAHLVKPVSSERLHQAMAALAVPAR